MNYVQYPWGTPKVPMRVWGTHEAHPQHTREISFICYLSNVTCGYCTPLPVLQVCLTSTGGLHCIVSIASTSFCCIHPEYYKALIPWKSMFYYILNIKMMSQSLSNFCVKLRAAGYMEGGHFWNKHFVIYQISLHTNYYRIKVSHNIKGGLVCLLSLNIVYSQYSAVFTQWSIIMRQVMNY